MESPPSPRYRPYRGIRIARNTGRGWGFVTWLPQWLPLVIDFGYLRYNRHWWNNLHARFAWVYRLHHGEWPTYWYWDKGIEPPADCEVCRYRHAAPDSLLCAHCTARSRNA